MLQRLGIRGKLLAVVAVPILVLIIAAGVITLGSVQDLNTARNAEELIDTLDRARDVQAGLQAERYVAANFVHTVQDGESKLRTARDLTESALDDIGESLAEPGIENPQEIQDAVDAALSRSGDTILNAERSTALSPATDESGGWLVFPTEDEIAQMQQSYAAVVADIDAIIEGLPADTNMDVLLSTLSFRVNNESVLATTLFTEPLEYRDQLDTVTTRVDNGVRSLQGSAEALSQTEENDRAVASLLAGQEAISEIDSVRADVRSVSSNSASVTSYYSDIIGTIVDSASVVAVAMADRGQVAVVQAYGDIDALVENIKYEEVVIERLVRAGSYLPGEAVQVREFTTETNLTLADAQNSASVAGELAEVPPFGASASDSVADANSFESVRTLAVTGTDTALFTARTGNWNTQVSEELEVYEPLRDEMWETIETGVASTAQNALVQTVITAIAVAAVVIVSIVVALTIARTIIGPLRRLTTTATAVRQELPRLVARVAIPGETVDVTEVQIPVESRDEVGRLAEAFNGVNAATLDIAGEQAALRGSISEMFVNVARRDQVLLNRQLASIDEMERTEDNPETLTKLFALDHLATRMRRNSESLLVLAGIDTGRRLRRPMPLSDVIRTASSEIELYERVQLELDVDPQMLGHSALTTAHLIAELLENATVFSDPGSAVVVRTAQRDGSYVVEVEDSGIGMTAKELEAANDRIGSTSASEILGAQRLGLFVVGRIARRVGATVTLSSQEGAGTVATVSIPKSSFAVGEDAPASRTQASTVDEATHAPAALTRHDTADEIIETPAQMPAGVGTYTPTSIERGSDLTGDRGPGEPTAGERSIEDLIASDAASAPVAEPADPGALTEGSTPAGLPTRRRRDTPESADAGVEQSSIVGLPARATDAQLSALAAEGTAGFTPAVPAAEVAPQTADERASMFRGFRARGGPVGAPSAAEPGPSRDEHGESQGVPADNAGAPALPVRKPSPAPLPAPTKPQEAASPRDAGMAAAGAAGAAAFFARRAREEAIAPTEQSELSAPSAPEMTVPQLSTEEPGFDHSSDAAAGVGLGADEPSVSTFSAPELDEPEPAVAELDEPAAPEVPVFRMPKFEPDPAHTVGDHAGTDVASTQSVTPGSAQEPTSAPDFDQAPFTVPGFADDGGTEAAEASPYPGADSGSDYAYGGVEQVSLEPEEPAADTEPTPGFLSASPYAQPQQDEGPPAYESPASDEPVAAYDQPAPSAASPDPWMSDSATEPVSTASPEQPAFEPETQFAAEPQAQPVREPEAQPEVEPKPQRAERSNADLDALLQTVADSETQRRPGFFSRLFGRGRHGDADVAGAAATEWADVGDDQSAPATAPSASMAFMPVSESAPAAAPRESLFAAQPEPIEPEPAEPPASASASASAPPAPASVPPWETDSQGFVPVVASQVSAPDAPAAPAWQSAPAVPEPEASSFEPAPAWEPTAQAEPVHEPQTQGFAPAPQQEPAGPQGTYTPDQLADARGWEAAGASALQAAQPDVATSYQPVIQPDEGGAGNDTDLTSAVFSEFSSLVSERPKVEKTRAGLERRRPSNAEPVKVQPIEETPDIAPAKRDAEEIRSRFSSFYSGTKRARDDVAIFDARAHSAESSDT